MINIHIYIFANIKFGHHQSPHHHHVRSWHVIALLCMCAMMPKKPHSTPIIFVLLLLRGFVCGLMKYKCEMSISLAVYLSFFGFGYESNIAQRGTAVIKMTFYPHSELCEYIYIHIYINILYIYIHLVETKFACRFENVSRNSRFVVYMTWMKRTLPPSIMRISRTSTVEI